MLKLLMIFLVGIVVFLLLAVVLHRRSHHRERPVTYICNTCGERDCLCHREERDEWR